MSPPSYFQSHVRMRFNSAINSTYQQYSTLIWRNQLNLNPKCLEGTSGWYVADIQAPNIEHIPYHPFPGLLIQNPHTSQNFGRRSRSEDDQAIGEVGVNHVHMVISPIIIEMYIRFVKVDGQLEMSLVSRNDWTT